MLWLEAGIKEMEMSSSCGQMKLQCRRQKQLADCAWTSGDLYNTAAKQGLKGAGRNPTALQTYS